MNSKKRTAFIAKLLNENLFYGARISTIRNKEYQIINIKNYYVFMLRDFLELPACDTTNKNHEDLDCILNKSFDMQEKVEVTNKIDIDVLKEFVRNKKKENKFPNFVYQIENHYYNAQYVLNCYRVLGKDLKFYQDNKNMLAPAIMKSKIGYVLLCPCRPPNK